MGFRSIGNLGLDRPLEQLFDLLGLAVVGEKLEEVVEVIVGEASRFENRYWSPLNRCGEVAAVEPIALTILISQ
jgi:hypothetical protein